MYSSPLCHALFIGLFVFSGAQVAAGSCPDLFNFVHVHTTTDGSLGPILRVAEDGNLLLHDGPPSCRPDPTGLTDDDNLPIPTVLTFGYAPALVASNLTGLGVTGLGAQAISIAEQNTIVYNLMNEAPNVDRAVGAGFVCLSQHYDLDPAVNCAIPNPFGGNTPVIVTCDDRECSFIIMPTPEGLNVSADWVGAGGSLASPFAAGASAAQMIADIYPFIANKIQDPAHFPKQ